MTDHPHILIIEAPYYSDITDKLKEGAIEALEAVKVTHDIKQVSGVFELAPALNTILKSQKKHKKKLYDGYLLFGCVIRGETSHYDLICETNAHFVQKLTIKHDIALGYGVLTCENYDQAIVRSDKLQKNKGKEAVDACLSLIDIQKQFNS